MASIERNNAELTGGQDMPLLEPNIPNAPRSHSNPVLSQNAGMESVKPSIAESRLQELVKTIGECRPDEMCLYHRKKRKNIALRLPAYYSPSKASKKVEIGAYGALIDALRVMEDDDQLAGSWQLMGEQREWFLGRLARAKNNGREPRIAFAVLGVPGETHLDETYKLVCSAAGDIWIDFFLIERCISPLQDIAHFLQKSGFKEEHVECHAVTGGPTTSYVKGKVTCHLLHRDLTVEFPLAPESMNIVSSHLTFSFFDSAEADAVLRNVAHSLRDGGHFLVAQSPLNYTSENVPQFFCQHGLEIEEQGNSWNIYALTQMEREALLRGESVNTANDTFLIDLVKNW